MGLEEDVFRTCLMKWQADGRFLERIQESQERQQRLLASLME